MSLEFGLQLYSVRDELTKDFKGTLEKVASIGYKNVELFFHDADNMGATIGNLTADELKQELDRLGLKAVSAHIDLAFLEEDKAEKIIAYAKKVGFTSLAIAIAFFSDKQEVLDLCAKLNTAGKMFKDNGLQLYYHNHFEEFQKFDNQYVLDIILENTDEELLKVEFDTYWALRGGIDPIEYLHKLGDRCDLIHQKDLPADAIPVNLFEVIGDDALIDMELMIKLHKIEYFTEAGQGIMDIPAIVEAFRSKPGARYLFIEQDWTNKNQLDSVEISYNYISKLFQS
ncbi:sugar phosphate isomerase/epimerase [Paenibacillus sp. N3/727]|uniref:sugar phosphate isomerase/epimerase family protein n=1 Tax=Paenibacillus sp. N3/727 TaxID=2925845 RepID=UPI001F532CB7|nr:sugar phosphate isomerase/epimerase [Paenibacillus sp. N3/727]UNK20710.1 sugar phosphate isomerase/epimerase [Paenibacillus sp. N3/727]